MMARMIEKEPKHGDSWKNSSIKDLKERLKFIKDVHSKREYTDLENISLVDLANQAMLLWLRNILDV
jgi:hypothetical protein